MNIMIISTPRRVDIYFVPSDVDDLKVVEDVHVHSEISSIVEDPLANLEYCLLMRVMCLLRVLVMLWMC